MAYLGEDSDSQDPDVIRKTEGILTGMAPYVLKSHSSEYISALANGDSCVAFGWSGDILQSRDRADEADNGVTIEYFVPKEYYVPKEGALMWFDQMAIPADAPNPAGAHEFLNFILNAQNLTASNYVYYANGNKTSQEFLEKDVIGDVVIYPDEKNLGNLYNLSPYGTKTQRVVTRLWTKFKSGI